MFPVLIKVDDFKLYPDMKNWESLINLSSSHNLPMDFGILSTQDQEIDLLIEWIKKNITEKISFFRHGHLHEKFEFNSSQEKFLNAMSKSKDFETKIFGTELKGFGAPWNQMSEEFKEFYYKNFPSNYLYYPDMDTKTNKFNPNFKYNKERKLVSIQYHISFELKNKHYDPDFKFFKEDSAGRLEKGLPLVLQIHPQRWSANGIKEFTDIINYLSEKKAIFLNPTDFIKYTTDTLYENNEHKNRKINISINGKTKKIDLINNIRKKHEIDQILKNEISWYKIQFEDNFLKKTIHFIEKILNSIKESHSNPTILDTGCGVGSWIYILDLIFPNSVKIGIEASANAAKLCGEILNLLEVKNFHILNEKVSPFINIPERISLSFCNRAANYFNLADYLMLILRNSKTNSDHYIGYQNWNFYINTLLNNIKQKNNRGTNGRLNILLSSIQFKYGYYKQNIKEVCISTKYIKQLLNIFNLNISKIYLEEGSNVLSCIVCELTNNKCIEINSIAKIDHIGLNNYIYELLSNTKQTVSKDTLSINMSHIEIKECPQEIKQILDLIDKNNYDEALQAISVSRELDQFDKDILRIVNFGFKGDFTQCEECIDHLHKIKENLEDIESISYENILSKQDYYLEDNLIDIYESAFSIYEKCKFYYNQHDTVQSQKYFILNKILNNCIIPPSTSIDKNTYFAHEGMSLLFHKNSSIGKYCTIGTQVSIDNAAKVGNYVYIGSGAKIFASIGDFCIIGANSVITEIVAPFSIIEGNPARKIGEITSENIIVYINKYFITGHANEKGIKEIILNEFNNYSKKMNDVIKYKKQ